MTDPVGAVCPECGARLRWWQLSLSAAAPLYFKCRSCRAGIRFESVAHSAIISIWGVATASIVLAVGGFSGSLGRFPRTLVWGIIAGTAAAGVMVFYASRYGRYVKRVRGETRNYAAGTLGAYAVSIAALLIVTLAILFLSSETSRVRFPDPASVERGEPVATDWSLRPVDGGAEIDLATLRGRVVFVNLWATWCGPCVAELPSIDALHDAVGESVAFVIASAESPSKVKRFVEKRGLTLPVFTFSGRPPSRLETAAIPATFMLDRKGRVVYEHVGYANWDTERSRAFLAALAAEAE